MLRWLGAVLILWGGLLTRRALLEEERRARRLRRELADALENMEAEIRLLLTPLPSLLRREWGGEAKDFFGAVSGGLRRGESFPSAWRAAAAQLPLPEPERAAVAALAERLGGGEENACAALRLCAGALRRSLTDLETAGPQRERLITVSCICISLFLAILLL